MRLARFVTESGEVRFGRLIDQHKAAPLVGPLFVDDADGASPPGDHRFEKDAVPIGRLLAPLDPPNIFCIGRNYAAHAAETGSTAPEAPLIFMKPTTAVQSPDADIVLPASAPSEVDFEAELVLVIGRRARNVDEAAALEHLLGFTCANDVSARDCQRNDKQWARAKGFDTFCPLGPWIVTRDELDPTRVGVRSRLNGAPMQNANTSDMIHSCAKLISYLSAQFTLLPGTIILTGTPEGVGMARTPPVFLKAGDVIEVEVDGIGTLRNRVR